MHFSKNASKIHWGDFLVEVEMAYDHKAFDLQE